MPSSIIGILGATKVWDQELCNGFATVISRIFKVEHSTGSFSAWIQATSVAGVPDLRFFYEMSYDEVAAHFAVPVGFTDIVTNLIVETVKIYQFAPPYLPYIRFKVVGNAGNQIDTLVTMHLCVQ